MSKSIPSCAALWYSDGRGLPPCLLHCGARRYLIKLSAAGRPAFNPGLMRVPAHSPLQMHRDEPVWSCTGQSG
uniref:Uncharacterized protein n=1 Tax=Neogobius melanostomus TaxID=47308 RepID=A0A8C6TWU0_9GOBI